MPRKHRKKAEEALLLALACGATVESAARSTGLSVRTVFRRLAEPEFRQRLQALRADMVQRAAGTLIAAAAEAIRTLLSLLQPLNSPAVRLGASRTILEMGIRMRDAADVETRLTMVEQLMNDPVRLTDSNEENQ
jgi:hypothetical protein